MPTFDTNQFCQRVVLSRHSTSGSFLRAGERRPPTSFGLGTSLVGGGIYRRGASGGRQSARPEGAGGE